MIFRDLLQEIVDQTDGAIAATLMGVDGIQVADVVLDASALDIQVIGIEFSRILKDTRSLVDAIVGGAARELTITTDRYRIIFYPVREDYFLVLLMSNDGNFGKARYLLSCYHPKITAQL